MSITWDPGHGFTVTHTEGRETYGVDMGGRLHLTYKAAGPLFLTPDEAREVAEAVRAWTDMQETPEPDRIPQDPLDFGDVS